MHNMKKGLSEDNTADWDLAGLLCVPSDSVETQRPFPLSIKWKCFIYNLYYGNEVLIKYCFLRKSQVSRTELKNYSWYPSSSFGVQSRPLHPILDLLIQERHQQTEASSAEVHQDGQEHPLCEERLGEPGEMTASGWPTSSLLQGNQEGSSQWCMTGGQETAGIRWNRRASDCI